MYGSSDDLVELEGAICDEFGNYSQAKMGISFSASDGTAGIIKYDGEWKIILHEKGKKFLEIVKSVGEDNEHKGIAEHCTSYSDVLILKEGIDWIKIGNKTFTN